MNAEFRHKGFVSLVLTALVVGAILAAATPLHATVQVPQKDNEAETLAGSGWLCFDITTSNKAKKATGVTIQMKDKKDADNEDDIAEADVRRIRITKIKYTKEGENEQSEVEVESTPTTSATVDFPEDADTTKEICVYISMHEYIEPTAEHPEPVGAETGAPPGGVKVNVIGKKGALELTSGEAGTATEMLVSNELVSVLSIAASQLGLSDTDYNEPDLILQSVQAPLPGTITFIPVGEFRFSGVPQSIYVFDATGTDLVTSGDIELGDAYINARGEVAVPVLEVFNPSTFPSWAMIVRGVDVILDDGADANSTHCYTIGGSSLADSKCDAAAIADGTRVLDNWETHTWEPTFTLGTSTVPVWDDQEQEVVDHNVGNDAAWVVGGADNAGYLPGLVLTGDSAGSISTGSVVFRPLYGFQFVEDENTELYVVNAANGNHVSGDVTASLDVTSSGSLIIDIDDLGQAANLQLQLIIVNPRVSYDGPVDFGIAYFMNVYGSALGGPMIDNFRVLEGFHADPPGTTDPGQPLPSDPITVHGWTAAASLND